MTTLGAMKTRIALEMRRTDLTTEIASAINSALAFYQYERFQSFNNGSATAVPASDGEINNPWMVAGERMIRCFAKGEVYANVIQDAELAKIFFDQAEQAKRQLMISNLYQSQTATTDGTLGRMKYRIANEIERGDLTTEIANAISTAIDLYQNDRFLFNESRDITFDTVAQQYIYTATDVPLIGRLIKIDYIFAYIGGMPYRLSSFSPEEMEWGHLATSDPVGQPVKYNYYAQCVQIYPRPDQVYSIRIGGVLSMSAPANDSEANNVWMTAAEPLIRSRAKFELYTHVPTLRDPNAAALMAARADEAYSNLKAKAADITKPGDYVIEAWGY